MTEYDSANWNLFKYPLIWFLLAAACAQITIAVYSPPVHAVSASEATTAVLDLPRIYPQSQGPAIAPRVVELPARQEIRQVIETPKEVQPAPVTQPVRATSSIEAVVQYALAQKGKPYVWGAAGPNAFDCSGLVLTSFARIGMHLPHFTGALIGLGQDVGRAALQRGDLVFPSSHHVAIYLGNGQMIHAPQPGEVVKISSVYAFYAARRLA